MLVYVISFTTEGTALESRLKEQMPEINWVSRPSAGQDEAGSVSAASFAQEAFSMHLPILFIGAVGIAVRTIAPFIKDKLQDSAVLAMDEKGCFIIPVLSGHAGGANRLARQIAEKTGAVPVITTATDVENLFSPDVFAMNNGFSILNRDGIKQVSSRILAGSKVSMWISPEVTFPSGGIPDELIVVQSHRAPSAVDIALVPDQESADRLLEKAHVSLVLVHRPWCIGMGCKKGKNFPELMDFINKFLPADMTENIASIASIDLKKDEAGLMALAQYFHVPFLTYTAEVLERQEGSFSESDFVRETTGTGCVSERAAVASAGTGCELVLRKTAGNGITVAVARRKPAVNTWNSR